jgi:CubicO group peptidase (beta-lactamase class C family)/beta-glucosidase-like glycosyl hydrolase
MITKILRSPLIVFLLAVYCTPDTFAQTKKEIWVDSVFEKLNTTEKIGQLFMLPVSSKSEEAALSDIRSKIKSQEIGGLIFTDGNARAQARIINELQSDADLPLFIAQESDGGLGMSLDSTLAFPSALVLGAVRQDSLLFELGKNLGRQFNMIGINLNLASANINTPAAQQHILQYQFLGEDPVRVASKATAMMQGMRTQNILTLVKSFPVKSIAVQDVQKDWPVVLPGVDSAQVYPFKKLFSQGAIGFVSGNSEVPLSYASNNLSRRNPFNAQSLSLLFTGNWVKQALRYDGLAVADIRSLPPIQQKNAEGLASLYAFRAGNDIILDPLDINSAIRKIRRFIRKEKRFSEQLDNSVKKILAAKYDAGLWRKPHVDTDNLVKRLNAPHTKLLNEKLQERAITILRNINHTLPIATLDNRRFAYVSTDSTRLQDEFYHILTRYTHADQFNLYPQTEVVDLLNALSHDIVIIGIYPQTKPAVFEKLAQLIPLVSKQHEVVLCDFGNEAFLKIAGQYPTVATAYINTPEVIAKMPEVLFGGLAADGILPLTLNPQLMAGTANNTSSLRRLTYSYPEDVGMSSQILTRIDSIAREAIRSKATPGCQVLVARNGKVIYDKSFGYLTYDNKSAVTEQTVYDLASLTKVSATLQATMFLYERGLIDINKKASVYLPELRNTNKEDLTIIDMLTHQSGLLPFIPLWPQTMKDTTFLPKFYSHRKDNAHPFQVAPGLYGSQVMKDSVWSWIIQSKLAEKVPRTPYPYKYSDLGLMIMQHVVEKVLNQSLDDFLHQNFYEPLGAYTTGFTPLNKLANTTIAPTEFDRIYRRSMIVGTVHDERAAMMGGVSGHAGLFSSANDLAKLGQMLVQQGSYGGYQYFKPETVQLFAHKTFKGRRGIGWDKPVQSDWNSPTSMLASPMTFGHTGFTGTCMWIDPEFNLLYIFLSNRVFPDRSGRLNTLNIRSRIQDVIYQSMFDFASHSQ